MPGRKLAVLPITCPPVHRGLVATNPSDHQLYHYPGQPNQWQAIGGMGASFAVSSRSAPTAAAMFIEWTTSANKTVTCLYSAGFVAVATAAPHLVQNLAFALHDPHDSPRQGLSTGTAAISESSAQDAAVGEEGNRHRCAHQDQRRGGIGITVHCDPLL